MNHLDAFHATVHAAPGGCDSLAPRMGMSAAILRNKACPTNTTNKPTLDDADRLMGITGDFSILHALAQNHGFNCTKIEDGQANDKAVLESMAAVMAASGNVGTQVLKALEDCRIEPHEVSAVRAAVFEAIRPMMDLVERLSGMAEKPVSK